MKTADMVRMANQIAAGMQHNGPDPVAAVADHIQRFWEPRMRAALLAHVAAGGDGLVPLAVKAAGRLRAPEAA